MNVPPMVTVKDDLKKLIIGSIYRDMKRCELSGVRKKGLFNEWVTKNKSDDK